MKPLWSRTNKELIAIAIFVLVAGWILTALAFDIFTLVDSYLGLFGRIERMAPVLAAGLIAFVVALLVFRFVILLRHRVPYGHCPHCGDKLEIGATNCNACNGVIRTSSNEHEKRTRHRGILQTIAACLLWFFLIAWAASFETEASLESKYFVGGEGFAIETLAGELKIQKRSAELDTGAPVPAGMVKDMVDLAKIDHDRIRFHKPNASRVDHWWFHNNRDTDRPYTLYYSATTPIAEIESHVIPKYNVRFPRYQYSEHTFGIPLWFPTACFFVLFLFFQYRNRAFPSGCCQNCGYDLNSVPSPACPECGTPKIESTYGIPTRWRHPARQIEKPQ